MNTFQRTLAFLGKTFETRLKELALIIFVYALLQLLMSIPIWVYADSVVNQSAMMASVLDQGSTSLINGANVLDAFTHEQVMQLIVILVPLLLSTLFIQGFVVAGLISMLADESRSVGERVRTFFVKGFKFIPRMAGANILLIIAVGGSIVIGCLIGIVVYPVAILFVLAGAVIAIYLAIKFTFIPFEVVLTKRPVVETFNISFKKTSGYAWMIFFITLVIGFASSTIVKYTTNYIGLGEIIGSLFIVVLYVMFYPIYLEASKDV